MMTANSDDSDLKIMLEYNMGKEVLRFQLLIRIKK
jgi:hypothetical protein